MSSSVASPELSRTALAARSRLYALDANLAVLDYLRRTLASRYNLKAFAEEQALLDCLNSSEAPDLILTGLQSEDLGYGQTGVVLAELLGFAHATIVMEVEPLGKTVRVKRELENGWFQNVALPLPAVLTIQSGIKKLRYATLMGIKKAKTKEFRALNAADLSQTSTPTVVLEQIALPSKQRSTQILPGSPKEAAAALVEKLKFEVRVI